MPEPPADASPPGPVPSEPWWGRLELVWPLSILAGFAGTWLGLASGLPGAAAVLAFAGFAPLYRAQLRGGQRFQAALLNVLWTLGIVGAAVGVALEGSAAEALEGLPGGAAAARAVLAFRGGGDPLATLPWSALAVVALLVLARPAWGLVALLGAALASGVLAAVALTCAVEAVGAGTGPSLAAAAGLPPHLLLALLGAEVGAASLAEPGLDPREPFTDLRRALLWSAVGLAGLGLGLQGLWIRVWQEWLGG